MFLPFDLAVLFAYFIGMSAGFVLYRTYVFPGSTRPLGEQSGIFILVNLCGAAIVLGSTWALLNILTNATPWPVALNEALSHGAAIGIGAIANFFGHKSVTFARHEP